MSGYGETAESVWNKSCQAITQAQPAAVKCYQTLMSFSSVNSRKVGVGLKLWRYYE